MGAAEGALKGARGQHFLRASLEQGERS
jgi:hypothetical protein